MQANQTEIKEKKNVLIVGAGCFGLSTAYYLLKGDGGEDSGNVAHSRTSKYNVTIIEASSTVPASDAASSDLNKVVRSTYSDSYYTGLAKEAISLWRGDKMCGEGTYHESGVLILGLQTSKGGRGNTVYTDTGLKNDLDAGARVQMLPSFKEISKLLPDGMKPGPMFQNCKAYLNADGGWAAASDAINALLQNVKDLGGEVVAGAKLARLLVDENEGNKVNGVVLEDGRVISADIVVLAAGAWSTSISGLPDALNSKLRECLTASGQAVATVRLPPELAGRYRQTPVLLDFGLGFYVFPPNDDNLVKFALHANGHTYSGQSEPQDISSSDRGLPTYAAAGKGTVSTPRTSRTHGSSQGTRVPANVLKRLHTHLSEAYPEVGALPLETTRLCWYLDTPDEDWIIDEVAGHRSLFIATGGSGHAFKFLPVIGKLVKSRIEGTMEESVSARFSMSRTFVEHHGSRQGTIKSLEKETLWGPEEFNEYLRGR